MSEIEERKELLRLLDKYIPSYLSTFPLEEEKEESYRTPSQDAKVELNSFLSWLKPRDFTSQELIGKTVAQKINDKYAPGLWIVYEISDKGFPINVRFYKTLEEVNQTEKQEINVV